MNRFSIKQAATTTGALSIALAVSSVGMAGALAKTGTSTTAATDQTKVSSIITAGDKEIARRVTTLGTLTTKINGATHLTASDKSSLLNEVSSETTGLNTLKAKLDADTTLDAAKADARSIYTDYRVYALVVPKVELTKVSDDQQVVEDKLSALATKLQTRLTDAQAKGKDVAALQTKLSDMTTQTNAAKTISTSIQSKVMALQPSDYNTDHTILSGDRDQLKAAHTDNQAAETDAKAIVAGLKNL